MAPTVIKNRSDTHNLYSIHPLLLKLSDIPLGGTVEVVPIVILNLNHSICSLSLRLYN